MKIKTSSILAIIIGIVICVMGYSLWWQGQQIAALHTTLISANNEISSATFDINVAISAASDILDSEMNYSGSVPLTLANKGVLNSMLNTVKQDLTSTNTTSSSATPQTTSVQFNPSSFGAIPRTTPSFNPSQFGAIKSSQNTSSQSNGVSNQSSPSQSMNNPDGTINLSGLGVSNTQTTNTQEYRNFFVNSCGDGIYYCTCLYDYLSMSYSDQQISALDIPNPNNKGSQITDPELVNAITACNQRFN
jgi:hypothetical protein